MVIHTSPCGGGDFTEGQPAQVTVWIEHSWGRTNLVPVDYATLPGSASEDIDYTPVNGTLTFEPNEDQKTISIRLLNDSIVNGNRDFSLVLSNPTGGVGLGSQSQIILSIVDDERGYSVSTPSPSGVLYLPEKAEDENGPPTVWVQREGDFRLASSVNYQVVAKSPISGAVGTATPDIDFIAMSGTLDFAPGEMHQKFRLTILDDQLVEGDESFFIILSEPTDGVPVATPETKVVIQDDEPNLVRVDPDFKPDLPIRSSGSLEQPLFDIVVQPDGKILAVTPANRPTG